MCSNFLSVRIAACLSESRGETARSEKPRRRHHGHTVAPNMQPVQNKWLPPGLPPIVQNGYPILSYVMLCVYEIIWVFICDDVYLLIVFDSFLEADHARRAHIIFILYIYTSIIIVTGLVPLGHVTS